MNDESMKKSKWTGQKEKDWQQGSRMFLRLRNAARYCTWVSQVDENKEKKKEKGDPENIERNENKWLGKEKENETTARSEGL